MNIKICSATNSYYYKKMWNIKKNASFYNSGHAHIIWLNLKMVIND